MVVAFNTFYQIAAKGMPSSNNTFANIVCVYLTATAAGLCRPVDLSHQLFTLAAHAVAQIPDVPLPLRLNLFCALCGAAAVALFYLLTARLVFIFACEDAGGALAALPPRIRAPNDDAPSEDDTGRSVQNIAALSIPLSVTLHNRRVSYAAVLAGLGSAAILAFCPPFWLAATRLYPFTFDLTLLFAIINLIISYDQRERPTSLFAGVFLLTVCSIESPLFLILLPVGFIFLLRSLVLNEQLSTSKVLGILLISLSGAIIALGLLWHASANCAAIVMPAPRPILRVYISTLIAEVAQWIPSFGWSHAFVEVLFPTAIAPFVFSYGFRKRTVWLFLLELMLATCLIPCLLNLPTSLWGVARFTSKVPIYSYVIIALFAGLMIAVWHPMREISQEKISEELDFYEYRDNPFVCRIGALLCWPLLALALAVPFRSYLDITPHEGTFADEITNIIYKELGARDWVVNCHLLRHHLMIRALQDGHRLQFLSTDSAHYDADQLAAYIEKDPSFAPYRYRVLNAADLSPASFIREWLKNETNAYKRVIFFDSPAIWRENGFAAVPTGFFLSGQSKGTPIDSLALLASHKALLESIRTQLFPTHPDTVRLFANYRRQLRGQLAFMANEIGVLLVAQNHPEEAASLFIQSEVLDPDNLSLLLNRYHLAANQSVRNDSLNEIENRLNGIPRQRDTLKLSLPTLEAECGTLVNPDTLEFVRKTYWTKSSAYRNLIIHAPTDRSDPLTALRDKKRELHQAITRNIDNNAFDDADRQLNLLLDLDDKDRFALLNKAMIAIIRRDQPEAGLWMDLAKENGAQPNELIWLNAALLILNNKLAEARAMLNTAIPADPSNIRLWGLLADILLKLNEYSELENRVYPALRSAASKKEHYLLYRVRGYIYKHHGVAEYTAARAAFLSALTLNKNLDDVQEEILRIDDTLDVPAFSEQDAKAVLRKNPEHAFANYLLGMVRFHRGEFEKAGDLFRRSLEKERNAPAYAGLGAVMFEKNDLSAAEKLIRRALELDGTRPFSWHMLAKVLLAGDHLPEAAQALEKAQKGLPDNADVRLTLIRLRIKQKKNEEAATIISDMLDKEEQYPTGIQEQLHALANQVSAELSK